MGKGEPASGEGIWRWILLASRSNYDAAQLARHCHLSTRQLRRIWRNVFGETTQAWLNGQRMIAGARCLLTHACVKATAYELGFKQVSHFCRRFKEVYGMTPSQFLNYAQNRACWKKHDPNLQDFQELQDHSHSIVAGGLLEMSRQTRLTPLTSLVIRADKRSSRS